MNMLWDMIQAASYIEDDSVSGPNVLAYGVIWTDDDCNSDGCLEFDGKNDFIETVDNDDWDSSSGSWELWLKTTNTSSSVDLIGVVEDANDLLMLRLSSGKLRLMRRVDLSYVIKYYR